MSENAERRKEKKPGMGRRNFKKVTRGQTCQEIRRFQYVEARLRVIRWESRLLLLTGGGGGKGVSHTSTSRDAYGGRGGKGIEEDRWITQCEKGGGVKYALC